MADLGFRGNVNGPQPIGQVVEPPPGVLSAADELLQALRSGNRAALDAMTAQPAREAIGGIAGRIAPGAYDEFELIGRARVSKHYYFKARLTGPEVRPITIQFRLGEDGGKWTVREAIDLTGRRSGWSK